MSLPVPIGHCVVSESWLFAPAPMYYFWTCVACVNKFLLIQLFDYKWIHEAHAMHLLWLIELAGFPWWVDEFVVVGIVSTIVNSLKNENTVLLILCSKGIFIRMLVKIYRVWYIITPTFRLIERQHGSAEYTVFGCIKQILRPIVPKLSGYCCSPAVKLWNPLFLILSRCFTVRMP